MWLLFWLLVAIIIFIALFFLAAYFQRWDVDDSPKMLPMDNSILSHTVDETLSPAALKLIDVHNASISLENKDRILLEKGYPVCREGMCIYDSATVQPHLRHHIMPRVTVKDRKHRIPPIILQSFNHSVLHEDYYTVISHTLRLNPHYEYIFHDFLSAQKLIRENFEPRVLQAYNDLLPGAYRCDLWRLCALYVYGGVYIDLKLAPYVPFDSFIEEDTDLLICVERFGIEYWQESIFNGFIATVPKNLLILRYIEEIVDRVESRGYGRNEWDITGPRVFSQVAIKELKCHWPMKSDTYGKFGKVQVGTAQWYGTRSIYMGDEQVVKLRLPTTGNKERFASLSGTDSYNKMWKERRVYATPHPRKPVRKDEEGGKKS